MAPLPTLSFLTEGFVLQLFEIRIDALSHHLGRDLRVVTGLRHLLLVDHVEPGRPVRLRWKIIAPHSSFEVSDGVTEIRLHDFAPTGVAADHGPLSSALAVVFQSRSKLRIVQEGALVLDRFQHRVDVHARVVEDHTPLLFEGVTHLTGACGIAVGALLDGIKPHLVPRRYTSSKGSKYRGEYWQQPRRHDVSLRFPTHVRHISLTPQGMQGRVDEPTTPSGMADLAIEAGAGSFDNAAARQAHQTEQGTAGATVSTAGPTPMRPFDHVSGQDGRK